MRYLEYVLNKMGFYRNPEVTDEMVEQALVERYGDPREYTPSKEHEAELFGRLARVDGFQDYLKATSGQDIIRYFSAQDEAQREMARGAYARTLYMENQIKKARKPQKQQEKAVLEGNRYG